MNLDDDFRVKNEDNSLELAYRMEEQIGISGRSAARYLCVTGSKAQRMTVLMR